MKLSQVSEQDSLATDLMGLTFRQQKLKYRTLFELPIKST